MGDRRHDFSVVVPVLSNPYFLISRWPQIYWPFIRCWKPGSSFVVEPEWDLFWGLYLIWIYELPQAKCHLIFIETFCGYFQLYTSCSKMHGDWSSKQLCSFEAMKRTAKKPLENSGKLSQWVWTARCVRGNLQLHSDGDTVNQRLQMASLWYAVKLLILLCVWEACSQVQASQPSWAMPWHAVQCWVCWKSCQALLGGLIDLLICFKHQERMAIALEYGLLLGMTFCAWSQDKNMVVS